MKDDTGKTMLILGCGYLGATLAEQALERGWQVKAVSRNAEALRRVEALGAAVFQGMIGSEAWHDFAGGDAQSVVNCVGSAGDGLGGYRESYLEGNRSLVRWAQAGNFGGRIVYTSSVSVYPDVGGDWLDEGCALRPGTERGRLMLESEAILFDALGGERVCALRLGGLYGPGRHLMLDSMRDGPATLPGWGDYYLNLVRLEDAVAAVWRVLENVKKGQALGVFNVVDDEPALKADIVDWLSRRFGNEAPRFVGSATAPMSDSRRFGEGSRPANRRVSNRSFKEAYDWSPSFRSFREGFGDLLQG